MRLEQYISSIDRGLEEQKDKLAAAGVMLANSNAQAGLLASEFVVKGA